MITEIQVKNYLKSKDKDYVNKLIESLYKKDDEDIDSSHKACPICGSVHFKKNGRTKTGTRDISVLTVTNPLVIELIHYSTGLISLWNSGFTSKATCSPFYCVRQKKFSETFLKTFIT